MGFDEFDDESESDDEESSIDSESGNKSSPQYVISFTVTESIRHVFLVILIVGNFLSINCGMVFLLLSWYIKITIGKHITFLQDQYQASAVPSLLVTSGFVMILSSLAGIKAAIGGRIIENQEEAKSAAFYFLVYLLACGMTVALIFIASVVCFNDVKQIREAFGQGLKGGMEEYARDARVKYEIDTLQMDYKCCGVDGFKDWYEIPWVDERFLDLKTNPAMSNMLREGKYFGKDVPFSCCRRDIFRPCIDTRIEDSSAHPKYSYPADLTLYTVGCRERVTDFLGRSVIQGVGSFVFFCLLIWITMTIITRYLHTSVSQISLGFSPVGWLVPYGKSAKTNDSEISSDESQDDDEDSD